MAMAIGHMFPEGKYDVSKAIKMAIIHDLVEAIATDIPLFETQDNAAMQAKKRQAEEEAIEQITVMAGETLGEEIKTLWFEHENQTSFEAKVIRSLDKLEAQIQHNEADLSTWTDWEKDRVSSGRLEEVSAFNDVTMALCNHVVSDAKQKLEQE